jgi:hypothetical protein
MIRVSKREERAHSQVVFELELTPEGRQKLHKLLGEVDQNERRLRIQSALVTREGEPETCVIFLKLRQDGASRLLVAHPENEEWVMTWALTPAHRDSLREWCEGGGESTLLSKLPGAGKLSSITTNLEVALKGVLVS